MKTDQYGQPISEGSQGRSPRITRNQIYNIKNIIEERKKHNDENKLKHYQNYGNGKFIAQGTIDRLLGRSYSLPEQAKSEGDRLSYHGGYYDKGTRNLLVYCSGLVPEYINKRELLSIAGFNPDGEITDEKIKLAIDKILLEIGKTDSQNEEINYDELPKDLKNNVFYNQGYEEGLKVNSKRGR